MKLENISQTLEESAVSLESARARPELLNNVVQRHFKDGRASERIPLSPEVIERILRKIQITDTGCWQWMGKKIPYAVQGINAVGFYVSRVMYEMMVEYIPANMCACHHCDNPGCCNPAHIFIGTRKDNIHDCMRKGRMSFRKQEAGTNVKLSVKKAQVILQAKANKTRDTCRELANKFGVSTTTIRAVWERSSWINI